MLPQSRRGQVLLGIVMFLSPFFLVRVILVMSGAIPGMTLLGSPAGVIDALCLAGIRDRLESCHISCRLDNVVRRLGSSASCVPWRDWEGITSCLLME